MDLLDRMLDKGLVIHADLIVSVAGIPLIGVNLRAALAGMETMLSSGVMQAWDEKTRMWESAARARRFSEMMQGESLVLRLYGGYRSPDDERPVWKFGYIHLTRHRLFLFHEAYGKMVWEVPLTAIEGLLPGTREDPADGEKQLQLVLTDGKTIQLTALDMPALVSALKDEIGLGDLPVDDDARETCPQCGRDGPAGALTAGGCPRCGWVGPQTEMVVHA